MAKKSIIDFEYDWDFLLTGIITTARDYQLCWNLNRLLNLKLTKKKDIELNLKKKNKLAVFCHFQFEDEMEKREYYLLGNKFTGESLIPEYKMVDYFLMIKGISSAEKKKELVKKVKELPLITALLEINAEELKSREHLIWIEV